MQERKLAHRVYAVMNLYHNSHWLPVLPLGMSVLSPLSAGNLDTSAESPPPPADTVVGEPPDEAAETDDRNKLYSHLLSIYQEKISAQESLSDTYSLDISESLIGMGKVQQQLGQH